MSTFTRALAVSACTLAFASNALAISHHVEARRFYETSAFSTYNSGNVHMNNICYPLASEMPIKATITTTGRMTGSPVMTAPGYDNGYNTGYYNVYGTDTNNSSCPRFSWNWW